MLVKEKNRLLNYKLDIYQDDDWFKFSLDSVLLANFVTLNLRCSKVMDLCSGNAPIPMLLSFRTNAHIYGVELQKCVYELGVESINDNNLSSQISLMCLDVKKIKNYFESESFDTVVCNPPYFKINNKNLVNKNDIKSIARHEVKISLDDVICNSFYLLRNGGNLAMVHRTDRFIEIISMLKKYKFEPKRVQFIYPKDGLSSDLFLIEATKNGNSGVKILPGLIIHNDDGSYKESIKKYFS